MKNPSQQFIRVQHKSIKWSTTSSIFVRYYYERCERYHYFAMIKPRFSYFIMVSNLFLPILSVLSNKFRRKTNNLRSIYEKKFKGGVEAWDGIQKGHFFSLTKPTFFLLNSIFSCTFCVHMYYVKWFHRILRTREEIFLSVYEHVLQIFDQIWKQYWNDLANI